MLSQVEIVEKKESKLIPEENFEKVLDEVEKIDETKYVYKRELVWRSIIGLSILHAGAIYGYIAMSTNPAIPWWSAFLLDTIARVAMLGVTAGSHRLWSHKSYKARLPLRIFLMLLQTINLQDDIYQWCRDHRLHHKHSDTNADPYNASRGFFFSHMGWLMVRKHRDVIIKGKQISMDDVWRDPVVRFQRRFYIPLVLLLWGAVPTYLMHWATGFGLLECFFGAVVFRVVMTWHMTWLVNSAAHLYGYQHYDKRLEPRENWFVNYVSYGEGYHNYHHTFPWDYSASELGWERNFNLTTMFIDGCAALGLAYDRRKPDPSSINARVEKAGNPGDRKRLVLQINTFTEYVKAIIVTYWVTLITFGLRVAVNGKV